MNHRFWRIGLIVAAFALPAASRATITINPWTPIYRGVDFTTAEADINEPTLQKVFALRVDLSDPTVEFFSTPSNGAGPLETYGQTTTTFVQTYGVSVGVNANFFSPVSTIPNDPRDLSGLAISRGDIVSPFESGRPSAVITRSNQVTFTTTQPGSYSNIWTAVSGSDLILINGSVQLSNCVTSFCGLNPRTALGKSQDNRYYYMVVIDGRQPGWSDGATLAETGEWMRRLGAWNALNLDGGGSSAMAKEQGGSAVLLNHPSGGVQRVDGNHIGVFALPLVPFITVQPQDQTVNPGTSAAFSVSASGVAPLAYQWRFNAANIAGATSSSYIRTNAQIADAGAYSVAVSNSGGSVTSSIAYLAVISSQGWGDNSWGQITFPTNAADFVAIAAGGWHSLGLRANGTVTAWGDNIDGQCDPPATLSNAVAVTAGGYHSLAITADGRVTAWGANDYGQANSSSNLADVIAVAAGTWHSVALRADGTVIAWGDNSWGQCSAPPGLSNAIAIAAGGNHSLALKADGTVIAWGENTDSQGDFAGQSDVPAGVSNIVGIAAGDYHSLAVKSDGTVTAWGDNSANQCSLPAGLTNVVALAAGGAHSLALISDGRVMVWGASWSGQCDLPGTLTNAIGIAAGKAHSLVLWEEASPVPQLMRPSRKGARFQAVAQTLNRRNYALEFKLSLGETSWTPLPSITGNGALKILSDPAATTPQRFYRLSVQQ